MEAFQTVLLTALLFVWLGISIAFFISLVQTVLYDRRREKRDQGREQRDLEYHTTRMQSLERAAHHNP